MDHLPLYVYLTFGVTVLLAIWLFAKAANYSKSFVIILLAWLIFRSALSSSALRPAFKPIGPIFFLLLLLPLLTILLLFNTRKGKAFIDRLDVATLTIFHVIRIPVEIVLFWLFTYKAVPELMTFEGRNVDILSGISAPIIYYFAFVKKNLPTSVLLVWNFVCLALVINIAFNAVLSAPTPFQQFAFDQPNIAIQYFPFVLLPACLVPLVLLAHFASIRQLLRKKQSI